MLSQGTFLALSKVKKKIKIKIKDIPSLDRFCACSLLLPDTSWLGGARSFYCRLHI